MNPTIERLQTQRREQEELVAHLLEKAETEDRDVVDAEIRLIEDAKNRITAIDAQLKPLAEFAESRNSGSALLDRIGKAEARTNSPVIHTNPVVGSPDSAGAQFIESDAFRSFTGAGRGQSLNFDGGLSDMEARAASVLQTGAAPGNVFLPRPTKLYDQNPLLPFRLWDLVNHVQVNTNSLDIVTYGTSAGGVKADVVPELGEKPAEELTAAIKTINLEVIAGYVEISRQLLQDGPGVRSWIDGELTRSIMTKAEADITALITGATVPKVTGATKVPLMGVIRQAQAVVQAKGFNPDVVLANPADFAALDQTLFAGGFMIPSIQGNYWGLRPVAVPGLTAGTVIVMDSSRAITTFERTGIEIFMSDSGVISTPAAAALGKDRMVHNIFLILAEARLKSALVRPDAAASVVVTP